MSVIQKIRDKYARWAVVAIAISLIGFLLMDAFVGRAKLFGSGNSTSVGRVNGTSVEADDFDKKVKQQEELMQQQGYSQDAEGTLEQAREQIWQQEVSRILLSGEIDKLGMQIGKKELGYILYGPDMPQDLKKQLSDQQTGQYDPVQAKQKVDNMLRRGTAVQKESFNTYMNQLEIQRMVEKLNSLLANSSNFPRWYLEKQNADNSQLGKISMVKEVYSSIPDSSIKISDKEIQDYIDKHKDDYKQDESRSIAFVSFSAAATNGDSLAAKNKAQQLKEEFDTTKDVKGMLAREGVTTGFYEGYIGGKAIHIAAKDSIFNTPAGHVYGPYLDGGSYTLAKVISVKQIPDTVKVRHILIGTTQRDQQTGEQTEIRDSATAYNLADSIRKAIANGSNFDSLAAKFSDDQGSKDRGGVYDKVPSGQMVSEFNNYIFTNPVGSRGIVKTDFGFHYIEIISQKGSSTGYEVAYLPKQISASTETDNNASNQASQFAGDSRDLAAFDANYEKTLKPKGMQKGVATQITPSAYEIQGLGLSRELVRQIYKAKKGEVLQPEPIGNDEAKKYVVAVVTGVFDEGTMPVAQARPSIEPQLRNHKKAQQIVQKIGKISTPEAAATVLGKQVELVDSIRMTTGSSSAALKNEPRVFGATFNPSNKGKVVSEALEGVSGVYVIRVEEVAATAVANANVAEQRKAMYDQAKQTSLQSQPILTGLRNAATIKDRRPDRY